ncbi:MAG: hypothetical protein RMI91_10290 [Gemmatales bacterium]|nr:hypothetical protein [Gemmatales bacterium]MDW7995031.1 hypothetical protein [Gemmatales bacterium]
MRVRFVWLVAGLLATIGTWVLAADREGEPAKPRARSIIAEFRKVDGTKLVLVIRGDSGERELICEYDSSTKFLAETDKNITVKIRGEGGVEREVTKPDTKAIALKDLVSGQRVAVTMLVGDEKTTPKCLEVRVLRPRPNREGKEGDRKPDPK